MKKFMLDCDPVSSVGSSISSLASEVTQISSNVSGYDTSNSEGFDFTSAKSSIVNNIEACSTKIQNTATILEKVVTNHTETQNRLSGKDKEEEKQANSSQSTTSGGYSSNGGGGYQSYSSNSSSGGYYAGATSAAVSGAIETASSSNWRDVKVDGGIYGTSTSSKHAGPADTTGWGEDKYTWKGYGEVVALENDGGMKVDFVDEDGNLLITSKLEDGKDVFYDAETGEVIEDLGASGAEFSDDVEYLAEMREKATTNGSDTDWYITVDRDNFRTTVLTKLDGEWKVVKTYDCGTGIWGLEGKDESHTFTGMWKVDHKSAYDGPCDWWTCYIPCWNADGSENGQGFHAGYTGTPEYQSMGCTRLDTYNAKWIFDNIPMGTTVEVF